MKKLVLIISIFMIACSGKRDQSYDDRFIPYAPEHINQIGQAVFDRSGLAWSDYSVRFYVGSDADVQLACDFFGDEKHVNACNFAEEEKIFIFTEIKDWCQILAHELTHQVLFYKNGDADSDHHSDLFSVQSSSELCLEMGIYP